MRYYSNYCNRLSRRNRIGRVLWNLIQAVLFRCSPTPFFAWRAWLVRRFGGTIASSAKIYPTVRIWAPWNLTMAEGSTLADGVDCYCVDMIVVGPEVTVSQRAFLCTASHDVEDSSRRLTTGRIHLAQASWVFAEAFIGPGVTVGEGAVVAARAVVVRDVAPWAIVGGNPARFLKARQLRVSAGPAKESSA